MVYLNYNKKQDNRSQRNRIIAQEVSMTVNKELLDILACPRCKGDVTMNDSEDGLICGACKLLYPIEDDIPFMLIDEARNIED